MKRGRGAYMISKGSNIRCYICLLEYEEGDSMRILPCNHEFHRTCIDNWLKEVHRRISPSYPGISSTSQALLFSFKHYFFW
ncbi:hypothetical protein ERO13_D07G124401v2 [Gossypium hirsutum]|uniref:RING-type domain-containing protein n=3 Tax=Gossypium TaxID=3633 RepID=A0A5D2U7I6_GOSMU|nr:hypothetical protein ERO13_D07G124401v2 [Gossypium hirsutum]TYH62729.1 hypothetical protein ES332_D07G140100v1 [Gossypium tomentosum]TYI73547.1 hypothetical protein E1A91_D07G136500v1 [Gossypium mustelinum]